MKNLVPNHRRLKMRNKLTKITLAAGIALAMAFILNLPTIAAAQSGERRANVKKLYETKSKEAEEGLKAAQQLENMEITDKMLENIVKNKAREKCNKEMSKSGDPRLGGMIITSKPINQVIDDCIRRETPEMMKRKYEIKEEFQKEMKETVKEAREALTLEGCRKVAEKDKDCTDDLIVKFDRFGTCTCETY
jgi:hypothetical protein